MQEEQAESEKLERVHDKTRHDQSRSCWVRILTRAMYLLSSVVFVMSLSMTVYADRNPEGEFEMPLIGFGALCFGWILIAGFCPAWIANLLLPPTIYYLGSGRPRVAFWYSTAAVLTSLTIFLAIPPFDRGQVGGVIFEGCWVWIGSIAVLWLSTVIRLTLDRFAVHLPICERHMEAAIEVTQSSMRVETLPTSSSPNFISSYVGGLALIGFIVACLLPVIGTDDRNPYMTDTTLGIVVLLMGWVPQSLASVAWLANPLAAFSMHSMFRGRRRMAIMTSALASVCSWFVVVGACVRSPAVVGNWRLLPGSWFWLASIALIWLSTMLRVDQKGEVAS